MASPEPDSLGNSLLAWVQSFEHVGKADTLGELGDGKALWSILQDVDNEYFSGNLPEPDISAASDWTRKWQNLKHLEKQLSMYYRDVCNGQSSTDVATGPDLKAIAENASNPDLEKLIMEILRAAMASPVSNQSMAKRLMGLGQEHAMAIAYEIRRMQEAEVSESEPASRDESAYQSEQEVVPEKPDTNGSKQQQNGGLFGDPMLEREEELLQARATIDTLHAQLADANRQVQQAKQDKEQLLQDLDSYRDEVNSKGRRPAGDDDFKKLQHQADSDRAYIEDLENQLQSTKDSVEKYDQQIQKYKMEQEASQKLRDDLQMMKAENEDLSQKVKANENLKKKIQTLQEQEKTNASLREELKEATEKLEGLDRMKQMQAALEKEIIEKKGLIRNQEYQINELTTTRKHVEYDAKVLMQKLEAAKERQDRDHDEIEELRAKLQDRSPDDEIDIEPPEPTREASEAEAEKKPAPPKTDENKHWTDKIALLEQQLEATDARLKQAFERNATLEDEGRGREASTAEQEKAANRLEEQETTIAELRRELETLAKQPREAPPADIAVLQRENHLMKTAWYDLSSRLQNNGVSLGRRRQEPKSWIGKQRAMVGPGYNLGHR